MRYGQRCFYVRNDEFQSYVNTKYAFLKMHEDVGKYEKIYGFINDLADSFDNNCVLLDIKTSHGGFVPLHCAHKCKKVFLYDTSQEHIEYIKKNIKCMELHNVYFEKPSRNDTLIIHSMYNDVNSYFDDSILIIKSKVDTYKHIIELDDYYIHIPDKYINIFYDNFRYYFKDKKFEYNNLINMVVMVKNGGELFKKMLKHNEPFIDRWTILDTGSTDGTQDAIREIMKNKKGKLYEEEFINFRESRNRSLQFADLYCKFNVILDDTYLLQGDLRRFLSDVRDDVKADSFSIIIKSDDVEYGSNRITKSRNNIRYECKIHEILQDYKNINVLVPSNEAYIYDDTDEYMRKRTYNRKQLDIELLNEMIEEEPDNPRHLYYLGQTYTLLGDYEKAADYFMRRVNHFKEGFIQEKIDACFELARTCNFKLNIDWKKCEEIYLRAYEMDKSRPDSLYFIGIHYFLENDYITSYDYFKRAFELGFPAHTQYSLKPTLSYYYVPKYLAHVCYHNNNYKLGKDACELFFKHNTKTTDDHKLMNDWYNIYTLLTTLDFTLKPKPCEKDIVCFVADGGFSNWTGRDILTKGVGGSETHVIEMSKYIKKHTNYDVYVFCKCNENDIFEGVVYKPLQKLSSFIMKRYVKHCIVSRFSEYLPMMYEANTENVNLFVHDIAPSGNVLINHTKLKNIFCLTEWHKDYLCNIFPIFSNKITYFEYGIDIDKFNKPKTQSSEKIRFIYSSFPNRGLLELLQMWKTIIKRLPNVELHIYCDVHGKWANDNYPEYMKKVREILETSEQVVYHGWVDKQILANGWIDADVWLYPCVFAETFCLTALEAALSKTLCITNGLAALQNTVGDRGVCIEGDPITEEWQMKTIEALIDILNDKETRERLIEKNYEWARNMSWENRAIEFVNRYINIDILEHKNMFNWTNYDESIHTFSKYLYEYKTLERCEILEIGTFTGVSIINMLYYVENSHGTVIDEWKNYIERDRISYIEEREIERSFYKNINTVGMNDRITVYKGNSFDKLLQLYKENKKFDIIYVDGSHMLFDAYVDIVTSWKLLNKNGLMILDDYYFNYKKDMTLECPKHGIYYFFNSLPSTHYSILHTDIRVFVKKLV